MPALPALILHPMMGLEGHSRIIASSRASLALDGFLPSDKHSPEDLERTILDGRYCEIEMLIHLGQDLLRWIDQCLGVVELRKSTFPEGIKRQSFVAMLMDDTPRTVAAKLRQWSVHEHRDMFRRAIGLNVVFAKVPPRDLLSDNFVRNYFVHADQWCILAQRRESFTCLNAADWQVELYSSGEYSRMLEKQWEV